MKFINHLEEWIISLMLLAMTGLTFIQVVLRYGFNGGFSWAFELTTVFFAIMIFIGISYGVREGSHIGVDALVRLLPSQSRRVVSIIAVLICLLYVVLVMVGAGEYVWKMKEVGIEMEDMPIQRWQVLAVMPLGFILTGWRFLQILYQLISGKTDSLHLADEVADALKLKSKGSDE